MERLWTLFHLKLYVLQSVPMPDNFSKNDIMDTAVMCYCKIYTSRIFYHKGIIIAPVQNFTGFNGTNSIFIWYVETTFVLS